MDKMSGRSLSDRDHRDRSRNCSVSPWRGNGWKIRGGGISRIEELTPEEQVGSEAGTATEQSSTEEEKPKEIQASGKTAAAKKKTKGNLKKQLADNGQIFLDVSKG
ncbi:hypothetical protein NE611_16920, partial [Anaerostipes caccae]|nr:hypothetical protein [Anaerostipes caccae]